MRPSDARNGPNRRFLGRFEQKTGRHRLEKRRFAEEIEPRSVAIVISRRNSCKTSRYSRCPGRQAPPAGARASGGKSKRSGRKNGRIFLRTESDKNKKKRKTREAVRAPDPVRVARPAAPACAGGGAAAPVKAGRLAHSRLPKSHRKGHRSAKWPIKKGSGMNLTPCF